MGAMQWPKLLLSTLALTQEWQPMATHKVAAGKAHAHACGGTPHQLVPIGINWKPLSGSSRLVPLLPGIPAMQYQALEGGLPASGTPLDTASTPDTSKLFGLGGRLLCLGLCLWCGCSRFLQGWSTFLGLLLLEHFKSSVGVICQSGLWFTSGSFWQRHRLTGSSTGWLTSSCWSTGWLTRSCWSTCWLTSRCWSTACLTKSCWSIGCCNTGSSGRHQCHSGRLQKLLLTGLPLGHMVCNIAVTLDVLHPMWCHSLLGATTKLLGW